MATVNGKFSLLQELLDNPEIDFGSGRFDKLEGVLQLLVAPLVLSVKTYAADGVADMTKTVHLLGSGIDITGFDPAYVGQVALIICTNSGTDATVDCTSATWDGTNDLATFPDTDDMLLVVATSTTRWHVVVNNAGVTFS